MYKKIIAFIVLFSLCASIIFAADTSSSNTTDAVPYKKDEFPDWAKYLRRFEIVTLGSLPFTTITATTVYTTYRYIKNDFDSSYMPNPFAFTSTAANIDEDEQKLVLYSALTTSLVIGIIDFSIYVAKKEKVKKANKNILPPNVNIKNESETSDNDDSTKLELPPEIIKPENKTDNRKNEILDQSNLGINDESEPEFIPDSDASDGAKF